MHDHLEELRSKAGQVHLEPWRYCRGVVAGETAGVHIPADLGSAARQIGARDGLAACRRRDPRGGHGHALLGWVAPALHQRAIALRAIANGRRCRWTARQLLRLLHRLHLLGYEVRRHAKGRKAHRHGHHQSLRRESLGGDALHDESLKAWLRRPLLRHLLCAPPRKRGLSRRGRRLRRVPYLHPTTTRQRDTGWLCVLGQQGAVERVDGGAQREAFLQRRLEGVERVGTLAAPLRRVPYLHPTTTRQSRAGWLRILGPRGSVERVDGGAQREAILRRRLEGVERVSALAARLADVGEHLEQLVRRYVAFVIQPPRRRRQVSKLHHRIVLLDPRWCPYCARTLLRSHMRNGQIHCLVVGLGLALAGCLRLEVQEGVAHGKHAGHGFRWDCQPLRRWHARSQAHADGT
mmetsp:Transcript_90304/g.276546  ORF Transcript_90304/g.276546 Transcript_90304/m.276546 type:complete len:407 (+) Transcript_90304:1044-2264(+)